VNLKQKVADSRLIKQEAKNAVALDPKQDVAYYLLGRWNFGVANIGFLPRAYVRIVYGGFPAASNEEAIKDFKEAIALTPGRILYTQGLAKVYEATGQKNLAYAELKKCAEMKPLDVNDAEAQKEAAAELASMSR
jgi:tetratricopeptide (TPR) repeat protein